MAAVLLPALVSCSAVVQPDVKTLGAVPLTCVAGTVAVCPCIGAGTGNQRCNVNGTYDACICGPAGSAGAKAQAAVLPAGGAAPDAR